LESLFFPLYNGVKIALRRARYLKLKLKQSENGLKLTNKDDKLMLVTSF